MEPKQRFKKDTLPQADFSAHRAALKEALMQDYMQNYPTKKKQSWLAKSKFKLGGAFAMMAVAAVLTFSMVASPLTSQQVLAQAQSASENVAQGRYRYTKSEMTDSYMNTNNVITTELWEDLETGDSRMVATDKSGTVIDTFVVKDDVFYATPAQDLANAIGLTEGDGTFVQELSIPAGAINIPVDEIGLDSGAHSIILESSEELPEGVQSFVLDDNGNIIAGDAEGIDISELNIEDVTEDVGHVEVISGGSPFGPDLTRASNTSERKELYQQLLADDNAQLVTQQDWEGRSVVGISYADEIGDQSSSNIMYFDAESYEYVGSEFSTDEFSFKDVVMSTTYSNNPFDVSVEGLEKLELLEL